MTEHGIPQGEAISDPEKEMVDPTHPYGPGGAKKDKERGDSPAIMQDPAGELVDPTHPHGEGGAKKD